MSGGITSTSERRIIDVPSSKQVTEITEESDDPADPDVSSSDKEIEVKP